jgi:hypothetical protein
MNKAWTLLRRKVEFQRTQNYKETSNSKPGIGMGRVQERCHMSHHMKEQHWKKLRKHFGKTKTNKQDSLLQNLYENENVKENIINAHASVRSWIFPQLKTAPIHNPIHIFRLGVKSWSLIYRILSVSHSHIYVWTFLFRDSNLHFYRDKAFRL